MLLITQWDGQTEKVRPATPVIYLKSPNYFIFLPPYHLNEFYFSLTVVLYGYFPALQTRKENFRENVFLK